VDALPDRGPEHLVLDGGSPVRPLYSVSVVRLRFARCVRPLRSARELSDSTRGALPFLRARRGDRTPRRAVVVEERTLPRSLRRQAAALLTVEWGGAWARRGYAGDFPPEFRVLALSGDDTVVGHVAAFVIPTFPSRPLRGIGDLVVAAESRGRGIAGLICEKIVTESRARGTETILVDTLAARGIFTRLGFSDVVGFAYFYEEDGSCRRQPHWLQWHEGPDPPRLELLAHGDF